MVRTMRHRCGFTLVELVVVLAVIALLSVLSLSAYQGFHSGRRAVHAAEMLASALSAARSQAIALRVPYRVVIQLRDPATGQVRSAFWVDELDPATAPALSLYPSPGELAMGVRRQQVSGVIVPPEGVLVTDVIAGTTTTVPLAPSFAVVNFTPSGASTYASIRLEDIRAQDAASRTSQVTVYPATGRARVAGGSS